MKCKNASSKFSLNLVHVVDILIFNSDMRVFTILIFCRNDPVLCLLFVFLALQPIVVVFSQPGSGL